MLLFVQNIVLFSNNSVEKIPPLATIQEPLAFFGTQQFITVLEQPTNISFPEPHKSRALYFILFFLLYIKLLSSHLHVVFPGGLFPSGFQTKILYTFFYSRHFSYDPSILSSLSSSAEKFWLKFTNNICRVRKASEISVAT
jgi:hypothetical protein